MNYELTELVPIVGRLAEKYTSGESTSITYEKAEQLMEAVLYCIHELENAGDNMPVSKGQMTAQCAYETGMVYVEQKGHCGYIIRFYRVFRIMKIDACMILLLRDCRSFSNGMTFGSRRKIPWCLSTILC